VRKETLHKQQQQHINEKKLKLLKEEKNDFSPVKIKPFTNDLHEGHQGSQSKK